MGYKAIAASLAVATASCSLLISLDELAPSADTDAGAGGDVEAPDVACTNTLTDPNNCGACGHSCCGGSCSRGLCTPVDLVSGLPTAPSYLVADVSGLYWIDTSGAEVWRSELDGTNQRRLLSGVSASRALPFDQRVYFDWADAGVGAVSLEGGAPQLLWKGAPTVLPAGDPTRIFWMIPGAGDGGCALGCVMSALHDGGDLRVSATLPRAGLALVGEGSGGVVLAGVKEVDVFPAGATSASPSLLFADATVDHPVADDRVYFGDYASSTIFAIEWDASVSVVVQGQGALKDIAARGDDLAWIAGADVRGCKVHDCKGTVQTLATDDVGNPQQPSIQGGCVYWVSPSLNAIRRTGL